MERLKEIIEAVAEKAAAYAGEWRFDRENPDIGTALALVYAQMHGRTLEHFHKIPQKMKQSFFKELGASLLPAIPSEGYLQFLLVNEEAEGAAVQKGTIVSAQGEGEGGLLSYETKEEVFVTPARVRRIYQTEDRKDRLCLLYDAEKEEQRTCLFSGQCPNLQEHLFYFCHDTAFPSRGQTSYLLHLFGRDGRPLDRELERHLACREEALFSYSGKEGFHPFAVQEEREEGLLLQRRADQPPFEKRELDGTCSGWIQCRVKKLEALEALLLTKLHLSSWNEKLVPESLYGDGLPYDGGYFLPFGEEPAAYLEAYIGCGEAFGRRGADIAVSFCLQFKKTPYGNWDEEEIQWDWVMKRPERKKEVIYETKVGAVLWEYYNGTGWKGLFGGREAMDIFRTDGEEGPCRTLRFRCPNDMAPVLYGALETYYIRARVIKMENPYKSKGHYLAPLLSSIAVKYAYPAGFLVPERAFTMNSLKAEPLVGSRNLFCKTGVRNKALYLEFEKAPLGSPIRFLLSLEEVVENKKVLLDWEYYGAGKWQKINIIDETEGMTRTGVISFHGAEDFSPLELFGTRGFWLRVTDREDWYGSDAPSLRYPLLKGLYENVAGAVQRSCMETEYFCMEAYLENKSFGLLHPQVYDIALWVKEGENEWVLWKQAAGFQDSAPEDRHFLLDCACGRIFFGDGKKGRIPPASREENIKVIYRCGGGRKTNLPAESINRMDASIGLINRARNPLPFAGGQDLERPEEAVLRSAACIRHQNRAVTPRDFEALARLCSRDILTASCFPGRSESGEAASGAVTLVILLKDAPESSSRFPDIKKQLCEYLAGRMDCNLLRNGKFFIREPEFARIHIKAEITVKNLSGVSAVSDEVTGRLSRFLKFDHVGALPTADQIRNEIYKTEGVCRIIKFYVRVFLRQQGGYREADAERMGGHPYLLPVSGDHEITARVE